MIYPNQRYIQVHKEIVSQSKAKGRLYLIEYQDSILDALKTLSSSAFKCYMVLLLNKSGHILDYSPEWFRITTGLCRATAKKALVELEEKHYIIKKDEKHFDFFDRQQNINSKTKHSTEMEAILETVRRSLGREDYYDDY